MCTKSCIDFINTHLKKEDAQGKKIIEVGARDYNGTVRPIVESLDPESYLGVDIEMGPCVDEICAAEDLVKKYGENKFDIVISLECLEHVRNWREMISNLKRVLKPGGTLYLTTRSKNFPYHGYPYDYWRYEIDDMKLMFSDLDIDVLVKDHSPLWDGVFIKAKKPVNFKEADLSKHSLYSIISRKVLRDIGDIEVFRFRFMYTLKNVIKRFFMVFGINLSKEQA